MILNDGVEDNVDDDDDDIPNGNGGDVSRLVDMCSAPYIILRIV
jgi:hypothetical protein